MVYLSAHIPHAGYINSTVVYNALVVVIKTVALSTCGTHFKYSQSFMYHNFGGHITNHPKGRHASPKIKEQKRVLICIKMHVLIYKNRKFCYNFNRITINLT